MTLQISLLPLNVTKLKEDKYTSAHFIEVVKVVFPTLRKVQIHNTRMLFLTLLNTCQAIHGPRHPILCTTGLKSSLDSTLQDQQKHGGRQQTYKIGFRLPFGFGLSFMMIKVGNIETNAHDY